MVGSLSAQIGLIAFAIAIVAGLHAGNSATTILSRAMLMMIGAIFAGQITAYAGRTILRDHLRKKKEAVERETAAAE